jgi:peroxiredoxin
LDFALDAGRSGEVERGATARRSVLAKTIVHTYTANLAGGLLDSDGRSSPPAKEFMKSSPWFRLLLTGITLTTLSWTSSSARESRKAAPAFSLIDANGSSVRLADYRGRIVLLDFWATYCGGCKVEIPWYEEFADKYKGNGLAVIGVSLDEDGWKIVKPFLANNPIKYPVVLGSDNLTKLYGVESMPTTLLIDRDGNIAASHVGMVDKGKFEIEIQTLLKDTARH